MFDKIFQTYDRIIFFDTETTGFDSDKDDQIIELAAMAVNKDGSTMEMDEFIQLETKTDLPEKITELTGITPIQLAMEGKPEEKVLRSFVAWMHNSGKRTLLAAHNAQFDLLFLVYGILRHSSNDEHWMREFNACDYLDTMTVYKDRHSYPHKLESAIERYNLGDKVQNSHRAIDDVKALYEVAKAMDAERDDLDSYVNIFGYHPNYGITGKSLKKIEYRPQGFNNYSGKTLPERVMGGN